MVDKIYRGKKLVIYFAHGASGEMDDCLSTISPAYRVACQAQMVARLERLGDFGQLRSPDQFHSQGDQIWAVKTSQGLRAYGFFGTGKFVVCCFRHKKTAKADPTAIRQAIAIRQRMEKS